MTENEIKSVPCPECGNHAFLDVKGHYHCREGHYWDVVRNGKLLRTYPK